MRSSLPILFCMLALTAYGCSSGATDPYTQAAQEVESAVAALGQPDADDSALDGMATDDADADVDEAADEAAEAGDASVGRGHDGRRGHHGHHGGRHGRGGGHKHGRGFDLLLAYADLEALQVCRDIREGCATSADQAACREEVRACVKPVIAAAFDAMCAERVAMCDAADPDQRSCKRVRKHCGPAPTDAGVAPDAG